MTTKLRIVVCGSSAGGVEALSKFFRAMPAGSPAAFLVVLHIPAHSSSALDRVLGRNAPMRVVMPKDGDLLEPGTIYVASPDRHLMVDEDRVRVTRGPKESRARPAIDVLFRSAAVHFGPRVIGVVLSGALDDGTAGLWAIKDRGGITMVQDPREAEFDSMPRSAIDNVDIDFVGGLEELASKITETLQADARTTPAPMGASGHEIENLIAAEGNGLQAGVMNLGKVSKYTCPDCHGVLVQIEEGSIVRFRCHTGHAFSMQSLLAEVDDSIDDGLWATLRSIEERVMLLRQAGNLAQAAGREDEAQQRFKQARESEERLKPIRELVLDPAFFGRND